MAKRTMEKRGTRNVRTGSTDGMLCSYCLQTEILPPRGRMEAQKTRVAKETRIKMSKSCKIHKAPLQDYKSSDQLLERGNSPVEAACRLGREPQGYSFHESSSMLGWVFHWCRHLCITHTSLRNPTPIHVPVSNPNNITGLWWNQFFGVLLVPSMGWTDVCSHLPQRS